MDTDATLLRLMAAQGPPSAADRALAERELRDTLAAYDRETDLERRLDRARRVSLLAMLLARLAVRDCDAALDSLPAA